MPRRTSEEDAPFRGTGDAAQPGRRHGALGAQDGRRCGRQGHRRREAGNRVRGQGLGAGRSRATTRRTSRPSSRRSRKRRARSRKKMYAAEAENAAGPGPGAADAGSEAAGQRPTTWSMRSSRKSRTPTANPAARVDAADEHGRSLRADRIEAQVCRLGNGVDITLVADSEPGMRVSTSFDDGTSSPCMAPYMLRCSANRFPQFRDGTLGPWPNVTTTKSSASTAGLTKRTSRRRTAAWP